MLAGHFRDGALTPHSWSCKFSCTYLLWVSSNRMSVLDAFSFHWNSLFWNRIFLLVGFFFSSFKSCVIRLSPFLLTLTVSSRDCTSQMRPWRALNLTWMYVFDALLGERCAAGPMELCLQSLDSDLKEACIWKCASWNDSWWIKWLYPEHVLFQL